MSRSWQFGLMSHSKYIYICICIYALLEVFVTLFSLQDFNSSLANFISKLLKRFICVFQLKKNKIRQLSIRPI